MGLKEKMLVLGLGLLVIVIIAAKYLSKNDAVKQLKEKYEAALLGDDREAALEAGRAYYRELRGRELNQFDEERLLQETAHIS